MSGDDTYVVIGSGSIAKRHISNLRCLYPSAKVVCVSSSGRSVTPEETGATHVVAKLEDASDMRPKFAVIASPAPFHIQHATAFLERGVPVFIEKPLAHSFEAYASGGEWLQDHAQLVDVAYNLRYLTSALKVKSWLDSKLIGDVHTVLVDVGQFLPDWRPRSDYRLNVSARHELGGGVLLELSHEIDYLVWLFGEFETVFALAGNRGQLDIDVEDSVDALLVGKDGLVVNLHMDFLQRSLTRCCKIIGQNGTILWNLATNSADVSTAPENRELNRTFSDPDYDRNQMYVDELIHFSKVVAGQATPAVGLSQAEYVLMVVDAIKSSALQRRSVNIKRTLL